MSSVVHDRVTSTRDLYLRASDAMRNGVYLYGAGFVGRWSVDYLTNLGFPVKGFIDSDSAKWGTIVAGKPVFSPTDPTVKTAKVILITSRHSVPAIQAALSHLPAEVMSVDAFVVHNAGREKIELVEALLAHDSRSLDTFRAVLLSMLEGNSGALATLANSRPFFEQFGFFNRDAEVFVDAGAYVGDSLERFIWSVNGVFRYIHAFEPGPTQFQAMRRRVDRLLSEWALDPDSISLVNKGISSESSMFAVTEGSHPTHTQVNHDRHVGEGGGAIAVQTVSLDDYFDGEAFTFLKVDIEGSEAALLRGAEKSIKQHRPRVALSVYHYPTDIFELPLQCACLNSEYVFTMGHHSFQLMETVLYCRDRND